MAGLCLQISNPRADLTELGRHVKDQVAHQGEVLPLKCAMHMAVTAHIGHSYV